MSMSCRRCKIRKQLKQIRKELRVIRFLLSRPRCVTLIIVKEEMNMITFAVVLPLPPANVADWAEIASGELSVGFGDVSIILPTEKAVQESDLRMIVDERFIAPQNTVVELSFRYIDDAGNLGSIVTASVELLDTVPPVAPDTIGLVATGEV